MTEKQSPESIILRALSLVMADAGYVQKTGFNKFHGYKFAGEADLLAVLRPAMVKHGLLLIPSAQEVSEPDAHGTVNVKIAYTLAHSSGAIWPEKIIAIGAGNDRFKNGTVGEKGVYKALSGANKYLLFKLFQIETGDDPEIEDHDKSAGPQISNRPDDRVDPAAIAAAVRDTAALLSSVAACNSVGECETLWKNIAFRQQFSNLPHDDYRQQIIEALRARKAVILDAERDHVPDGEGSTPFDGGE